MFVEEPLKDNEEQLNIPLNSRRTLNLNKFQLIFFTTPQSLLRAVRLKIPLIRTQKIS